MVDNQLLEYRYAPDGHLIEDYDPKQHKRTRNEWVITNKEVAVAGQGKLANEGGFFSPSLRLSKFFSIGQGIQSQNDDSLKLFFYLKQTLLCLKFDLDAIPATIVVARSPADEGKSSLKDCETSFGKRSSLLLLPIPTLSAQHGSSKPGHFLIEIKHRDCVSISDLGSRNGTLCYPLTNAIADGLVRTGTLGAEKTLTHPWNEATIPPLQGQQVPTDKKLEFKIPVMIQASKQFRILIC